MTELLKVSNASKMFYDGPIWRRQTTVAVDNISFSIADDRPSITGVVGESGSGKTTLALLLLGYAQPSKGQVVYRGQDLADMSKQERFEFRRVVQPIFQDPFAAFNPFYLVDHVLQVPIKRFNLASTEAEAEELIVEALQLVGLRPAETLGRFPHQLSGGQRQRIMVARALLCRPQLIIADEPVSMVDASLRATILASLQTLNRDLGISIVYITHDLTTAHQVCDNIIVMYGGQVVEAGAVGRVIRDPQHPYTQLLVSSIPLMDRSQRWENQETTEPTEQNGRVSVGCKFAPRCPHAEDRCWTSPPPLYQTESTRAVACVLQDNSPVLEGHDVTSVFL